MAITGNAPLEVTFTDESTPAGEITYWLWTFGDGNTSEEQNPVHTYETPGSYTVRLAIASAKGTDYVDDTVTVTETTYDEFTLLTGLSGSVPITISANDFISDAGDYDTFEVSVGGGVYASSYDFADPGTITVHIRGLDPLGGFLVNTTSVVLGT